MRQICIQQDRFLVLFRAVALVTKTISATSVPVMTRLAASTPDVVGTSSVLGHSYFHKQGCRVLGRARISLVNRVDKYCRGLAPCSGDRWKIMRRLAMLELLSNTCLDLFRPVGIRQTSTQAQSEQGQLCSCHPRKGVRLAAASCSAEYNVATDQDFTLRDLNMLHKARGEQIFRDALSQSMLKSDGSRILQNGADCLQAELSQGSSEWYNLRKGRITASAFGTVLGFWKGRRMELWQEKVGLKEPFAGNSATRWGSTQEAAAVERYKEITGNQVDHVAFKIYEAGDIYLSWLGASPDGLVTYKVEEGRQVDENFGILEVKCPHNKGRPEHGIPWDNVPYYYMPQAQGLLEIFDRDCMDFYVWTINGSAVFRINRDPEYWGIMFRVIAEFWWGHVVPAKRALVAGASTTDLQAFKPLDIHPSTTNILELSKTLAKKSQLICKANGDIVQHFQSAELY